MEYERFCNHFNILSLEEVPDFLLTLRRNVIADVDEEDNGCGGCGRDDDIGGWVVRCGRCCAGGTRDGGIWHRGVAEGGAAEGNETGRAGQNHRHVLSGRERRQELQGSDRLCRGSGVSGCRWPPVHGRTPAENKR